MPGTPLGSHFIPDPLPVERFFSGSQDLGAQISQSLPESGTRLSSPGLDAHVDLGAVREIDRYLKLEDSAFVDGIRSSAWEDPFYEKRSPQIGPIGLSADSPPTTPEARGDP